MIIGIGGVSRAGKTTLTKKIHDNYKKAGKNIAVFCQDDYVKPKISIPTVQGVLDWERPNTIKWDVLINAINRSTAEIILVEGLFAFYPASLRSIFDVKLFVEIDKKTFETRRREDERWQDEPEWYIEHVWRSFLKYGQMKGDKAEYVVIDGTKPVDLKKLITLIPQ